jgi:hypothetical protein
LAATPGLLVVIANAAVASATIKVKRRNRIWGASPTTCSIDLPALKDLRGPGESYTDVILRLAKP